jgi:hypothetical protein
MIRKYGSGLLVPNIGILNRYLELRLRIEGLNNGDAQTGTGITRFSPSDGGTQMWRQPAGQAVPTYFKVDNRRTLLMQSTTLLWQALFLRPFLNAAFPIDFRDVLGLTTSSVAGIPSFGFATSIMAWVRKQTPAAATHCKTCIGFCDLTQIGGPAAGKVNVRAGLIGDGTLGFRFGSVNAPTGNAVGDNAATDVDANFVQPAELVSPGANWFHVRIKMIPPTSAQGARWGGYLNGRLQGTFALPANFVRGSNGVDDNYNQTEAGIMQHASNPQIDGVFLDDVRVWLEEDYTL